MRIRFTLDITRQRPEPEAETVLYTQLDSHTERVEDWDEDDEDDAFEVPESRRISLRAPETR